MALYQQILIQPASLAATGDRRVRLTRDDLHAVRENTLALIHRGAGVPVLLGHAPAGSVDGGPHWPTRDCDRRAQGRARVERPPAPVGHLVDLVELEDGSLLQVIELDGDALAPGGAARAPPRFTSPEIRPYWIDGQRRWPGPLIAHIALTDAPLCPGQTLLEVIEES